MTSCSSRFYFCLLRKDSVRSLYAFFHFPLETAAFFQIFPDRRLPIHHAAYDTKSVLQQSCPYGLCAGIHHPSPDHPMLYHQYTNIHFPYLPQTYYCYPRSPLKNHHDINIFYLFSGMHRRNCDIPVDFSQNNFLLWLLPVFYSTL